MLISGPRSISILRENPEGVDLPTELGLDGIHLDPPGKKLMAEAVNEQWEKVLAQFAENSRWRCIGWGFPT